MVGLAENDSVGAPTVTVTERLVLPSVLVHVSTKVLLLTSGLVTSLPEVGF